MRQRHRRYGWETGVKLRKIESRTNRTTGKSEDVRMNADREGELCV